MIRPRPFRPEVAKDQRAVQDDHMNMELELMNDRYSLAKIKFSLQNITRQTNDSFEQLNVGDSQSSNRLKSQVHQGGVSTPNVVFLPTNEGAGVKGLCNVPPASA